MQPLELVQGFPPPAWGGNFGRGSNGVNASYKNKSRWVGFRR